MPSFHTALSPTTTRSWMADAGALFDLGLEPLASAREDRQIGPYRLLSLLGEGGLGSVWKAEQKDPVQRMVALKLIRPGLHLRSDVIARFHAERRTLARLTHPSIAALYDAGTTDEGVPFFAMELVDGSPLTTYCRDQHLPLRGRLDLFISVCDAVHYAHQKGVLHRDLKPSNILVTNDHGHPVPKIIDFGIAKIIDAGDNENPDAALHTRIGDLPSATYPYMSPEQATCRGSDIDTRSDIYTLGVILYELLTGQLPMPEDLVRSGNFESLANWVLHTDPIRPSERVRSTGPHACDATGLRGELDWITLRATAKEPDRRYSSAAALADDLRRHLADEPVEARPPGASYLLRKWLRRHRTLVAASSTVVLGLSASLVVSLAALNREKEALARESAQRTQALQREADAISSREQALKARQAESAARALAEQALSAAEQSRKVADGARSRAEVLINDMLFDLRDDLESIGRLELLDQVSQSAEDYFGSIPLEQDSDAQRRQRAAMHQNRGSILLAKGDDKGALIRFEESLTLLSAPASSSPQQLQDLVLAHERVGVASEALGKATEARLHYEEMKRIVDRLSGAGEIAFPAGAVTHERLGDLSRAEGDAVKAEDHYKAGLKYLQSIGHQPEAKRRLAIFHERLAGIFESRSENNEALLHTRMALDIWLQLLKKAPQDNGLQAAEATASGRMAALLLEKDATHPEAVTLLQHQLDVFVLLTQLDPLRVVWKRSLGVAHLQMGGLREAQQKHPEAEASFRSAAACFEDLPQVKDADHGILRDRAAAQLRLAVSLARQNRMDEARRSAAAAIEFMNKLPTTADLNSWRKTAEELIK